MTTENDVRFTVRLPAKVYEWLKRRASEEGRSMNKELIQVLKRKKEQANR